MEAVRDKALEELSPYFDQILDCVLSANEEQQSAVSTGTRAKIRKRTQSNLMNDIVVHNLMASLDAMPEVSFKERYGQMLVTIRTDDSGYCFNKRFSWQ